MTLLQKLFKSNEFARIHVGHRVRHIATGLIGKVIGVSRINGPVKISAISVMYDDGRESDQAVETEFVIIGK